MEMTFNFYNYSGNVIDSLDLIISESELVILKDDKKRSFKINEQGCGYAYVYRFLKRQIKVIDVKNFIKHIEKSNSPKSPFNTNMYSTLEKLILEV